MGTFDRGIGQTTIPVTLGLPSPPEWTRTTATGDLDLDQDVYRTRSSREPPRVSSREDSARDMSETNNPFGPGSLRVEKEF